MGDDGLYSRINEINRVDVKERLMGIALDGNGGNVEKPVRVQLSGTVAQANTAALDLLYDALRGSRGSDQKRIAEVGLQVVTTLLRKNKDYGSSAHKAPLLLSSLTPRQGIQVRMSDKIHRLMTLLDGKGQPEVDEKIEETMLDLVGYGILWLTSPE